MITTVSLNPSIDRTLSIDGFHYGSMNRVLSSRDDACGKAVNVAIVASRLGAEACCIGLMARQGALPFRRRLKRENVAFEFIPTPGRVRVNLKLLDERARITTEINERGASVDARALAAMTALAGRYAARGGYLVLTGSMPPGCPEAYYETLGLLAGDHCRVVLDADGAALSAGLRAKPFFIKPNREELEQLVGSPLPALGDVRRAARVLRERGIGLVCVTLGSEGALLVGDGELFAEPLKLEVRSTVGAGDSLIGALLTGLGRGEDIAEAFRMGVAAASAAVASEGTDLVLMDIYRELYGKIRIQRL